MLHQYVSVRDQDLDTFVIYLDQLSVYYNNYMVRFYGICLHPQKPSTFYLIFDYQAKSLGQMLDYGQIIDDCQVGAMVLQVLYLIRFLHSHDQPRCLGKLNIDQIYWPMCVVLPYLAENQENSIEGDVRIVGQILKEMLTDEKSEDFDPIMKEMLNENKYNRVTLTKCITKFEEILSL